MIMFYIELVVAFWLGILGGVVTGLIPGLHVNLLSVLVVSFSPLFLLYVSPVTLGVFIISLAISQSFLNNIPGIYLGAPEAGLELNVLPGHRLLLKGEGHNAVVYTLIGSLGSLLLGMVLFPFFIWAMARMADFVQQIVGYLLIIIIAYMILKEKGYSKKLASTAAFFLSGTLGMIIFSLPGLKQPLLPLLSGLFGISLLLLSLFQKSHIPEQDFTRPLTISKSNTFKSVSAATGAGFLAAFLPGFGSSQAAIMATNVVGDIGDEGFLSLVGGINTANMLISLAAAYILDKARNGAIVAVNSIMGGIGMTEMLLFLAVSLAAGGVATILTLKFSKLFAHYITKVNYRLLIKIIIVFIAGLTFYFDGLMGLLILLTATALGLYTSYLNVGKNHLMGCLILPVILYFVL